MIGRKILKNSSRSNRSRERVHHIYSRDNLISITIHKMRSNSIMILLCFVSVVFSSMPIQGKNEDTSDININEESKNNYINLHSSDVNVNEDLVDIHKTPYFDLIQREDGLSNMSISSSIQDKYGYLWFGTQGGLNRYDGDSFLVFRNDPYDSTTLAHNLIQTMYYDELEHVIWIGTYQGVSKFDIHTQKFTNYTVDNSQLSNSVIVAINKDTYGNIWLGTLKGLNKLNQATNEITSFDIPGDTVRSLCLASDGDLYIGTTKGLLRLGAGSSEFETIPLFDSDDVVMVIKEFDEGLLTLGLWEGGSINYTIKSNTKTNTKTNTKSNIKSNIKSQNDISVNHIYSIEKTNDGTLWIGTWGGGLYAFTKDGNSYHYSGEIGRGSLVNPVIYSLLEDKNGSLWIGTNGGGLNRISPRKVNYIEYYHDNQEENSISNGKINALYVDADNRMWVAVYNQGINIIDQEDKVVTKVVSDATNKNSIPNNMVRTIIDFNGRTVIGTDMGLGFYDYNSKSFEKIGDFEHEKIYSIAVVDTTKLWIGTLNNGLYLYDINKGIQKHYYVEANDTEFQLLDNSIYDLLLDSQLRIWGGTNHGIFMIDSENVQPKFYVKTSNKASGLASNSINCIIESKNNDIWIGTTDGGLTSINNDTGQVRTYTERDGLTSNTVFSLNECSMGHIWASTQNGISILDISSASDTTIISLSPEDGIGGYEFTKGHYQDADYLYFSGVQGVIKIPSDYSKPNELIPDVFVTSIKVYNKPLESISDIYNGMSYTLDYDDSYLSFTYTVLDYERSKNLSYFVMLKGVDNTFVDKGNEKNVNYSRLKPGKYEFNVYAMTSNGLKSDPVKINFLILKPWYLSRVALIVYSFFVALLLYLSFNLFKSSIIKRKNIELATINNELEKVNSALENLSITDSLTGVYNRRYFESYLTEKVELAIRNTQTYLTLIMVDFDNFKEINDKLGHQEGDRILQEISRIIKSKLPRSTDIIARYGGDEFILVLYDTNMEGAKHVIEKIQQGIIEVDMNINCNGCIPTISFGSVTVLPDKNTIPEKLLKRADNCLYDAKRNGKNQAIYEYYYSHQND